MSSLLAVFRRKVNQFRSEGGASNTPLSSTGASTVAQASRFGERVVRIIFYVLAFATPLLVLPYTQDALFLKVTFVEVAAVLLAIFWILDAFSEKGIRYLAVPWNIGFLVVFLASIAATIASRARWMSFWGSDATGEKTMSILAFIVVAWIAGSVLRRAHVERLLTALLTSFLLLGLYVLPALVLGSFVSIPTWLQVNPIGTVNALAYAFASIFLLAFGIALLKHPGAFVWLKRFAIAAAVVLFLDLVLIGFQNLWIALSSAIAVFTAVAYAKWWNRESDESRLAFGIACIVLAASVFLAIKPTPLSGVLYQPPAEVSPSFSSTLSIGYQTLKERPLFGFGPSNFVGAFNKFRDPSINQTDFWTTRFNHGYSLVTTLISTVGIVGLLAYLAFILLVLVSAFRFLFRREGNDPLAGTLLIATLFVLAMWVVYAGNFSVTFLLFLLLGFAGVLLSRSTVAEATSEEAASWWQPNVRSIVFESAFFSFASALVLVFAAALSLIMLYGLVTSYAGEAYFLSAARAMNVDGNIDVASARLSRAITLNPTSAMYHQADTELALASVLKIIQTASANPNEDLRAAFQQSLERGIQAGRKATSFAPGDPQSWFVLGQLYEAVLPFVDGAYAASLESYMKAREADPSNPVTPFAIGRMQFTYIDLLTLRINQTASGGDRTKLEQERSAILAEAKARLQDSANLKPDYAPAHFLLAQIAIRENNSEEAIKRTEATIVLAPNDVGVAFQLGVLYYTAGRLDEAKDAFNRAVALNDNYSNARYFLGLIWDRKGDRDASLSQFQKIAALNPDNEEIARIITNITAGRPALMGIVPPLPAPERRKDLPVKDKGENPDSF